MKKNILIESDDAAKIATSYLIDEKLVALKTETVYGISCDPGSPSAIKKQYFLSPAQKNYFLLPDHQKPIFFIPRPLKIKW